MNEADPALQFFAEGEVDLYGALELTKEATAEEIKKAYRKQALKHHPDKQQQGSSSEAAAAAAASSSSRASKFQQIGFAYSVLSSESRKSRYDTTGRTDESMFEEGMDWNAYFKELWTGEVSAKSLEIFKKKYRHSLEEVQDIIEAYTTTKGDLLAIIDHVPFLSLREDQTRLEEIIEKAIYAKEIDRLKKWDKTRKDKKLLSHASKKEAKEEEEAMEMAKELGVYDDLFGRKESSSTTSSSMMSKSKDSKSMNKKRKNDGGDEDFSALQNIIAKRNEQRGGQIDGLIAKLEADAAKKSSKERKNKKAKSSLPLEEEEEQPNIPNDEEFEKIRARLDANKTKKRKT